MTRSSNENAREMEGLISQISEREDVVNALSDVDISKFVADWLVHECGIERWKVLLGLKIVTPIVVSAAKGTARIMADGIKQRMLSKLNELPWAKRIVAKLNDFSTQTTQKNEAVEQVKAMLEHSVNRAQADVEHREALSLELQVLLKQQGVLAEVQDTLDLLVGLINKQPVFKDVYSAENERQKFVYRSQYVPFSGREVELSILDDFLNCNKRFAWKAMTGPGGVGKSRLALEFCQQNGGAWRAGVLLDSEFDFWAWQPNQPTLIVIDYATNDLSRLKEILSVLTARRAEFAYSVRILLLDRDNKTNRLGGLSDDVEYGFRHVGPDIVLEDAGVELVTSIFKFFFQQQGVACPDSWDDHLARLEDIDPRRRPLFAAYYSNEVAIGSGGQEYDRESLLNGILKNNVAFA